MRSRGMLLVLLVLGAFLASSAAASASNPVPHFSFVYQGWSSAEQAQLETWDASTGLVMKTVTEVAGPPARDTTITVVKEASNGAGDYDSTTHHMRMTELKLDVLAHELMHATRDTLTLSISVWEEGLARAGEKEVMRLLALKGVTEAGYDTNHEYGYDEYYEANNVFEVGVPYGNIYIEPALTLLRYEQSGYAFSMVLMENPQFLAEFNAKVFTHPNGNLSAAELVALAAETTPEVDGLAFAEWEAQQLIFDANQQKGCYLFQRTNQLTVDFFSVNEYGAVTMLEGAKVKFTIKGPNNELLFKGSGVTTSYGWVDFEPQISASTGRLKMIATAKTAECRSVKSTFYRPSGAPEGVFGVVTNATAGTVTLSSPTGQFTTQSVPVTKGAFAAPKLTSARGRVDVKFEGEGRRGEVKISKDAAPFEVLVSSKKAR